MRLLLCLSLLFPFAVPIHAHAQAKEPEYPLTEDSKPQPNTPKGSLLKDTYISTPDSVYPGAEREYSLYLPHGFDPAQPAAYMVFQDGVIYQAPVVFDNLIARKEIPPLVGIFIRPGIVPAANLQALPRFNRSYEYDSVSDRYARFLTEEFLPAIQKKHELKLSTDANDAGIVGSSSGGIAAFVAAWHRPDVFRRIYTGVGTYVGLRGGDQLTTLVRKTEPKPLKIFLQDGSNDLNIYCGDWWMANQMMERSFQWAGYAVNHTWGEGGHNGKHATQALPDALRWLWKDWQTSKEIKPNPEGKSQWKGYEIFEAGATWQLEASEATSIPALMVDATGKVAVADRANARALLTGAKAPPALPTAFQAAATALSPDQTLLYASLPHNAYVHAFQIGADGRLHHGQPFFMLHALDDGVSGDTFQAAGMCVDTQGRLYVATNLGVQVCDQAGRVNFIIPTPSLPTDVCFGGKDLGELFIACGSKIYKRPTKVRGLVSSQMEPITPEKPRL